MKKLLIAIVVFAAVPMFAYADICSDISNEYNNLITMKQLEAEAAMSQTTSSEERQGIWDSFMIQKSILEAERDATLTATGCTDSTSGNDGGTDPGTDGDTGSGTDGNNDGTGDNNNDGSTDGNDDDGNDVGEDPNNPGDDAQSCEELKQHLQVEVTAMRDRGASQSEVVHFANTQKPLIREACSKRNTWGKERSRIGGNSHPNEHEILQQKQQVEDQRRGRGKARGRNR